MTHAELVERAIKWLKNNQKCQLVISESYSWYTWQEVPDALGFRAKHSVLVECKTSRSDFIRDKKKRQRHRRGGHGGLGVYRYYLTPKGLISLDELPKKWGLIEVRGKIIKKIKEAYPFNFSYTAHIERPLLVSIAVSRKGK